MRFSFISGIVILAMLLAFPVFAQPGEGEETFGNKVLNIAVPDGWEASEVREEVEDSLLKYDDQIVWTPIEIVPDTGTAGMMIIASGRTDTLGTFFDYIMLLRSRELEIIELFSGETELVETDGNKHETRVTINALDDGDSEMIICHDFILFKDDIRYEFAYISPAETYAANYGAIEEILAGLEFLD